MKIMVCTNNVPDTSTKIIFTNNNTQFNTCGMQFILNPYYGRGTCTEHVAQIAAAISPNLYIAIENTGDIHHPAKIDSSRNKNTEVPFFKVVDYDFVGTYFNMAGELIATVKENKAS